MNDRRENATEVGSESEEPFVIDMAYLRQQASEATALFFMPLLSVFRALTGGRKRDRGERGAE